MLNMSTLHTFVLFNLRNKKSLLWSPFFLYLCCYMPVNMHFVKASISIHNTLKGKEFNRWVVEWWAEFKDRFLGASAPPVFLLSVTLSESTHTHTHTECDVASADVDTLAALSVLLCALGNDKTMMLPNFLRPAESPCFLSWNKAVISNSLSFQFNSILHCITSGQCGSLFVIQTVLFGVFF